MLELQRKIQPSSSPSLGGSGINWQDKGWLGPVKNQAQCGSCWAFAATAAVESAKCIKEGGGVTPLSEQQITSRLAEQQWLQWRTVYDSLRQQQGICTEEAYPYKGEDRSDYEVVPTKIKQVTAVRPDEDSLHQAIQQAVQEWCVAITTELGHAVLAHGYTDDAWLIKNSWGSSWGENGMIRLARGTVGKDTCGVLTSPNKPHHLTLLPTMKYFVVCASVVAASMITADAKPLHAGLNYHRYLQEVNETRAEVMKYFNSSSWDESIYKRKVENRDADPTEDEMQRYFLAKQTVEKLSKDFPGATFSVESPFTMLTDSEFLDFIKKSGVGKEHQRMLGEARQNSKAGSSNGAGKKKDKCRLKTPKPSTAPSSSPSTAPSASPSSTPTSTPTAAPTSSPSARPSSSPAPGGSGVNWQDKGCLAPVKNQGQCGSCWAFAATAAIESAKCIKEGGSVTPLSDQQITSCDRANNGCNGGSAATAFKFIEQQQGICTEEAYPYKGQDQCRSDCKVVPTKIKEVTTVKSDEDSLVKALDGRPVVVILAAGNTAWKQYKSGVLPSCDTTNLDHAVLAYGYTDDAWLLKNSWGSSWGEKGMIRLARVLEVLDRPFHVWATSNSRQKPQNLSYPDHHSECGHPAPAHPAHAMGQFRSGSSTKGTTATNAPPQGSISAQLSATATCQMEPTDSALAMEDGVAVALGDDLADLGSPADNGSGSVSKNSKRKNRRRNKKGGSAGPGDDANGDAGADGDADSGSSLPDESAVNPLDASEMLARMHVAATPPPQKPPTDTSAVHEEALISLPSPVAVSAPPPAFDVFETALASALQATPQEGVKEVAMAAARDDAVTPSAVEPKLAVENPVIAQTSLVIDKPGTGAPPAGNAAAAREAPSVMITPAIVEAPKLETPSATAAVDAVSVTDSVVSSVIAEPKPAAMAVVATEVAPPVAVSAVSTPPVVADKVTPSVESLPLDNHPKDVVKEEKALVPSAEAVECVKPNGVENGSTKTQFTQIHVAAAETTAKIPSNVSQPTELGKLVAAPEVTATSNGAKSKTTINPGDHHKRTAKTAKPSDADKAPVSAAKAAPKRVVRPTAAPKTAEQKPAATATKVAGASATGKRSPVPARSSRTPTASSSPSPTEESAATTNLRLKIQKPTGVTGKRTTRSPGNKDIPSPPKDSDITAPPAPDSISRLTKKRLSVTEVEAASNRLYEDAKDAQRRKDAKKMELEEKFPFAPQLSTKSKSKREPGAEKNRFVMLHEKGKELMRRKEELRAQQEKADCTFKPKITSKAKRLSTTAAGAKPRYENLYQQAQQLQQKREEKKLELERIAVEECSFKPRIRSAKSPVSSRPLYDAERERQRKAKLEQKKMEAEMSECTFKPKVVSKTKKKATDDASKGDEGSLYDRFSQQRSERMEKLRQEHEEQERVNATFQPKISTTAKSKESTKKPFYERLYNKDHAQQVQAEREQKRIEEESKYTFKPQISDAPEEIKAKLTNPSPGKTIFERLYEEKDKVKEKIEMSEELKKQKELEECTFHPHVDVGEVKTPSQPGTPIWERLLSYDKNQVIEEREKLKQEKEMRECTFKPDISPPPAPSSVPRKSVSADIFERLSTSAGNTPVMKNKKHVKPVGKRNSFPERGSDKETDYRRVVSIGDIIKSSTLVIGSEHSPQVTQTRSLPGSLNSTQLKNSPRKSGSNFAISANKSREAEDDHSLARELDFSGDSPNQVPDSEDAQLNAHSKSILQNYDSWAANLEAKMRSL
ncbi:TPA: hypothetical protein N0F65_012248 [Lagenidium giganteum]|uniref:Peptidase C1A papain C-terminal domain-containing protein n=1 Tax=Lagenidium giganteum TaxID=4803 RepID=A0AAV2ZFX2_9STRA|nr:TPA: hypothetical protein N0F65_012248 [Lagenidium giganteum]